MARLVMKRRWRWVVFLVPVVCFFLPLLGSLFEEPSLSNAHGAGLLGLPIAFFTAFFLMRYRVHEEGRLEELLLTPMHPREIVAGIVYPPTLFLLSSMCASLLGLIVYEGGFGGRLDWLIDLLIEGELGEFLVFLFISWSITFFAIIHSFLNPVGGVMWEITRAVGRAIGDGFFLICTLFAAHLVEDSSPSIQAGHVFVCLLPLYWVYATIRFLNSPEERFFARIDTTSVSAASCIHSDWHHSRSDVVARRSPTFLKCARSVLPPMIFPFALATLTIVAVVFWIGMAGNETHGGGQMIPSHYTALRFGLGGGFIASLPILFIGLSFAFALLLYPGRFMISIPRGGFVKSLGFLCIPPMIVYTPMVFLSFLMSISDSLDLAQMIDEIGLVVLIISVYAIYALLLTASTLALLLRRRVTFVLLPLLILAPITMQYFGAVTASIWNWTTETFPSFIGPPVISYSIEAPSFTVVTLFYVGAVLVRFCVPFALDPLHRHLVKGAVGGAKEFARYVELDETNQG